MSFVFHLLQQYNKEVLRMPSYKNTIKRITKNNYRPAKRTRESKRLSQSFKSLKTKLSKLVKIRRISILQATLFQPNSARKRRNRRKLSHLRKMIRISFSFKKKKHQTLLIQQQCHTRFNLIST